MKTLTLNDRSKAAQIVVQPDRLVWVIVGDREKVEKGIRELNLGEIRMLDTDGNPVR